MPAPRLTAEEQAEVDAGRCACLCKRPIALEPEYSYGKKATVMIPVNGNIYAERGCRQRAYENRKRAGRVLTSDDRHRIKLGELAKAERYRAAELKRRIAELRAELAACELRAEQLEIRAGGQLPLPSGKAAG